MLLPNKKTYKIKLDKYLKADSNALIVLITDVTERNPQKVYTARTWIEFHNA